MSYIPDVGHALACPAACGACPIAVSGELLAVGDWLLAVLAHVGRIARNLCGLQDFDDSQYRLALTESVTNIVGRADLPAAFGVLAGLLCHARAVTARTAIGDCTWITGSKCGLTQSEAPRTRRSVKFLPPKLVASPCLFNILRCHCKRR